ncbi:MAG: hypothetical protein WD530_02745, partial [Vicingaceae bacterium]
SRLRFRKNAILVDFYFNNIDKPIHFQVDTFIQGGKVGGEDLAKYYTRKINQYSKDIQGENKDGSKMGSFPN